MKKALFILFSFPTLVFSQTGTFSVALTTSDSIVYDTPGAFLSVHGTIYNLSLTDSVELSIEKQFVDIPVAWETALCTDVCYPSTVSFVTLSLAPADSQEFVFYFYTDLVADSGYTKVVYTNLNVPGNTVLHGYHGITLSPVGISEKAETTFSVYPNPANDLLSIKSNDLLSDESYIIADELGKTVRTGKLAQGEATVSVQELSKGLYLLNFSGKSVKIVKH